MSEEIKEILEIFKKINEEYSVDTELDFEDYEIPNIYLKQFLNYITNLQEENIKLKELCDKYEEEHKTTFIEWQKDIKANKKAIEYINKLTAESTEWESKCYKQKEVLDKMRDKCLSIKGNPEHTIVSKNELVKQFLELLEEIE